MNRPLIFAILIAFSIPAIAQPPGRGGDRGGSDRGGGGPPGGGPPGGGFPGGGPPFGGGDRGGGGRPSFDPSEFIKRLDRNGNGAIDPDEMEGPARFMIDRMAREDPKISTDKPIPIEKITKAFEKMRADRAGGDSGSSDRGGSDRGGSDRGGSERDGSSRPPEMKTVELLVPDFKQEVVLQPIVGFGPAAELFSIPVSDADLNEAAERIRSYDRNKDGMLSKDELSGGRWSGNPMDFDRNHDGKLSQSELAVRSANRRELQAEADRQKNAPRRNEPKKVVAKPSEEPALKSYRLPEAKYVEGAPEWFTNRDANRDGQVEMHEYSERWDEQTVAAFNEYDLNGDGIILPAEAMSDGRARFAGSPSSTRSPTSSSGSPSGSPSGSSAPRSAPQDNGPIDSRFLMYATKQLGKMDKNGNGVLDPEEYNTSLLDLRPADANGDAKITAEEYARHLSNKARGG